MSSKTELIRSEGRTLVPPHGKVKPGPRFANRQEMQPWLVWTLRLVSAVLFFGLWEWASSSKVLDPFFFPAPSQILGTLGDEFTKLRGKPAPTDFGEALGRIPQAKIWADIWETLAETLLGFVIGTVLGLGLGFLFGRVKPVSTVYMPLMVLLNALPRIALGPLFLIWFGIGFNKSVALSVSIVLFIVFFNVYSGLKEVDQSLINNARILGANEGGLIKHVLFPSAVGWIFNSLRISVSFALVGAVLGEYLAAQRGIGFQIATAASLFEADRVFANLIILVVIVLLLDAILQLIERRFSTWKQTIR